MIEMHVCKIFYHLPVCTAWIYEVVEESVSISIIRRYSSSKVLYVHKQSELLFLVFSLIVIHIDCVYEQ